MVAKITAHIQLFNLPVFTKFCKDILVELLEMTLCCFDIEERFPSRSVLIEGRLIHVGIDYSLTLCGFVVKARTTFPVATCTDFEIKGTIHSVCWSRTGRDTVTEKPATQKDITKISRKN
jgi:hypothetical protein